MERDDERVDNLLRRLVRKSSSQASRANCPEEEALANYLSGSLSDAERTLLDQHLSACSYCVDELAAAFRAEKLPITDSVPERLIDRARSLVAGAQAQPGVFDVVVRLVKDSLELVRTTGEWIIPLTAAPVGVRGRAQPGDTSILQLEKQIGDFKVGIEVERVESDMCQVAVSVVGQGGTPADNLRVSLFSGGREQASYLTKNGEAVFERIPQGAYDLQISDSGVPVGVVRLAME